MQSSSTHTPFRVAIIGAGASGAACAAWLAEDARADHAPIEIHIFDKGRRVGGRASSLPSSSLPIKSAHVSTDARLDYGALIIGGVPTSTEGGALQRTTSLLRLWADRGALTLVDQGLADQDPTHPRWVAPNGISPLIEGLIEDTPEVTLHTSHHVRMLTGEPDAHSAVKLPAKRPAKWHVSGTHGGASSDATFEYRDFDLVVCSAPAPQSAALLSGVDPEWSARLASLELIPQWVAIIGGALTQETLKRSDHDPSTQALWDPTLKESEVIERVGPAVSLSSKSLSSEGLSSEGLSSEGLSSEGLSSEGLPLSSESGRVWRCIQARAAWSEAHLDASREEVGTLLCAELARLAGDLSADDLLMGRAQRWRLARVSEPLTGWGAHLDSKRGLAGCGDSYRRGGVIGALESAELLCAELASQRS